MTFILRWVDSSQTVEEIDLNDDGITDIKEFSSQTYSVTAIDTDCDGSIDRISCVYSREFEIIDCPNPGLLNPSIPPTPAPINITIPLQAGSGPSQEAVDTNGDGIPDLFVQRGSNANDSKSKAIRCDFNRKYVW